MKIGLFDSGIGGLSVLHRAIKRLPDAEYIYYADTDNVPYGEKSKETILSLAENVMKFLTDRGVDAVVIACNTATSVAVKSLRQTYDLPIIGMEPAVKKAREDYPDGRTLVMATPVTVSGDKMRYLLERVDSKHLVDMIPMTGLVKFAEEGLFDGNDVQEYIRSQLRDTDLKKYASLVLGCTHFNYFKKALRRQVPDTIAFVDGIEGTVSQLLRKLGLNPVSPSADTVPVTGPQVDYFISSRPADEADVARFTALLGILDEAELL